MNPSSRPLPLWALALVAGSASGALAGSVVAAAWPRPSAPAPSPAGVSSATFREDVLRIVRESMGSVLPQAPTSTATSPAAPRVPDLWSASWSRIAPTAAASLYRTDGVAPDGLWGPDRLIGQAVALTGDGWFVTSASSLSGLKLADLGLAVEGQIAPVRRAEIDRSLGLAFLKVEARRAPAAFGRVADLAAGDAVWVNPRPGQFVPAAVRSVSGRVQPGAWAASEMVQRRLLLDGVAQAGDRGAPVWAKDGTLLGLLDAAPGEPLAVVPVTGIPSAFSSLVSDGAIRTATLGVQATDLTGVVRAAPSSGPVVGAWIHEGRKGAVPAVAKDGPAKNLLKAGDTVLAIDRDILDGTRDLGDILSEYRPGAKVTVRVSRDGADLDVPVVLGGATVGEAVR